VPIAEEFSGQFVRSLAGQPDCRCRHPLGTGRFASELRGAFAPNCPHLLAGIDLLIADERTLRLIDLKRHVAAGAGIRSTWLLNSCCYIAGSHGGWCPANQAARIRRDQPKSSNPSSSGNRCDKLHDNPPPLLAIQENSTFFLREAIACAIKRYRRHPRQSGTLVCQTFSAACTRLERNSFGYYASSSFSKLGPQGNVSRLPPQELGVSRRTVFRDIHCFETQGFRWCSTLGNSGNVIAPYFRLPNTFPLDDVEIHGFLPGRTSFCAAAPRSVSAKSSARAAPNY